MRPSLVLFLSTRGMSFCLPPPCGGREHILVLHMVGTMLDYTAQSRLLHLYQIFGPRRAGQRLYNIHTLSSKPRKGIRDGGWGQGRFYGTMFSHL